MTGHRSFGELRARMSPERRERNRSGSEAIDQEITLQELRAIRQQSQSDVARSMSVLQPAVAKLERRGDMYVSNLARYVEALGGKLVITAEFPGQSMTLQLGTRDENAPDLPGAVG